MKKFEVGSYSLNEIGMAMSVEESYNEFMELFKYGYLTYLMARAIASLAYEYDKEVDPKCICNDWFSNHTKTYFYETATEVMLPYFEQLYYNDREVNAKDFQIAFISVLDWTQSVLPEIKKLMTREERKALRYFYRHRTEMVRRAQLFSLAIVFGLEKLGYKTLEEMENKFKEGEAS